MILAGLILQLPLCASELIVNGSFEAGTLGSTPDSWTIGGGFQTEVENGNASPFNNINASSTQAASLTSSGYGYGLLQDLGPRSGTINLNFDFFFATAPTVTEDYSVNLFGSNGGVSFRFQLTPGSIALQPTSVSDISILTSTWYNLQATLDTTAKNYSGSLTQYGGSSTTWTNQNMNQNSNPLAVQYFNVQSNNFDGVGPAFVLDNVSVQLH